MMIFCFQTISWGNIINQILRVIKK
jgi:hypothetical protein